MAISHYSRVQPSSSLPLPQFPIAPPPHATPVCFVLHQEMGPLEEAVLLSWWGWSDIHTHLVMGFAR